MPFQQDPEIPSSVVDPRWLKLIAFAVIVAAQALTYWLGWPL